MLHLRILTGFSIHLEYLIAVIDIFGQSSKFQKKSKKKLWDIQLMTIDRP